MADVWDKVAVVKRGKNRLKGFWAIHHPVMPSELMIKVFGKSYNIYFSIISRALVELAREGLVSVKNPKERTGRLYELTVLLRKVRAKIGS